MLMKLIYTGVFAGLAAMCYGGAGALDAERWPRLRWHLRSVMYGAAIAALAMLLD
jgi:hypothetical protein